MLKDNNILLGKANDLEIVMQLNKMNRHGIIAGASGDNAIMMTVQ